MNNHYNNICIECMRRVCGCKTTTGRHEHGVCGEKINRERMVPAEAKLRDIGYFNEAPPIPVGVSRIIIILVVEIDETLEGKLVFNPALGDLPSSRLRVFITVGGMQHTGRWQGEARRGRKDNVLWFEGGVKEARETVLVV